MKCIKKLKKISLQEVINLIEERKLIILSDIVQKIDRRSQGVTGPTLVRREFLKKDEVELSNIYRTTQ